MKKQKINAKIIASFACIAVLCVFFASILLINIQSASSLIKEARTEDAAASLNTLNILIYIFIVVLFILTAVLTSALIKNISNPLKFLASAISGIAQSGNIYLEDEVYKQSKILNKRGDEIGDISRSVGDMLAMFRDKIKSLKAVASGDLAADIICRSQKDTIGTALVAMVESLNGMFKNIQSVSNQVSFGSERIDEGAHALAQGSGEQAESIEQLSDAIGTVSEQTSQNAKMALQSADLSEFIKKLAEKGGEQMKEMMDAVNQINESSDAINKVIKIIDEIAFQTNILALNASVEAARAGHHGKGFAVVAKEIRDLATRSQNAARDTGYLITDSINKARLGSKIAEETSVSLSEIVDSINKSTGLAGKIARSSDEQATAISRINTNIEQVKLVVHRNSETAAQSADDSNKMSGQAIHLQKLIGQFKIRK